MRNVHYVSVLEHDQWRGITNHELTILFGASDILTEVKDSKAGTSHKAFMFYGMKNGALSK